MCEEMLCVGDEWVQMWREVKMFFRRRNNVTLIYTINGVNNDSTTFTTQIRRAHTRMAQETNERVKWERILLFPHHWMRRSLSSSPSLRIHFHCSWWCASEDLSCLWCLEALLNGRSHQPSPTTIIPLPASSSWGFSVWRTLHRCGIACCVCVFFLPHIPFLFFFFIVRDTF